MKEGLIYSGKGFRVLVTVVVALFLSAQFVTAQSWYNPTWPYRVPLTIENSVTTALTDYQVQVNLGAAGPWSASATDGSDLRFTAADGVTEIPYWIDKTEWIHGDTAVIWVKVPAIAASGDTTIYMYYGADIASIPPVFVATPPSGPFTKAAGNPIIADGDPNTSGQYLLAENIVYDPVSQHYWMAFSNYRAGQSVGLMWSDDPTDPDAWNWESGSVIANGNAPHLMQHNGTWYIFYSDRPTAPFNIVVQSSASVNGPYSNKQIILTPTEDWEGERVDEPFVFQRNDGKWVLVYMGAITPSKYQIGYATADMLTGTYQRYNNGDEDNEGLFIPYGDPGTYDAGIACHPWVYEFEDTYYIGYTASSTTGVPYQTAMATTKNWSSYVKQGIILPGTTGDNAFRGGVTRIGEEYVFTYTGGASPAVTLGIATQPVFAELIAEEVGAEQVFDFYDAFNGSTLDLTKWGIASVGGTGTITPDGNGLLTITQPAVDKSYTKIYGLSSFGTSYVFETRTRHDNPGAGRSLSTGFNIAGTYSADGALRIGSGLGTIYWRGQAATSGSSYTWNDLEQLSDAGWHTFRIYREPSGTPAMAGYQLDNNNIVTISTNVPASSLNPYLMCYGTGNIITSDWVRVRKWAGEELPVTIGNIEVDGCQWLGNTSSDWADPANWTGGVPDSSRNVLITTGGTWQPLIGTKSACRGIIINPGATLTIGGTNTLSVAGDWTNNGTFVTSPTATIIFNGETQSIGGSSYNAFQNMIVNSSVLTSLSAVAELYGNLTISSGVFDIGQFTINTIQPACTLTVSDGATLKIGASNTLPSGYATHAIGAGSFTEYYGGNQVVGATTYGNLVLSGSGVKTISGSITVLGNLRITGSAQAFLAEGTSSTANTLILGTEGQAIGVWGSTDRDPDPQYFNDIYFASTGLLSVNASFTSGHWLGMINDDWNTVSNWYGGIVPVAGTDVIIPAYAYFKPVITGMAFPAECNNLTLNEGATLSIDAGQALTVNGALLNNGSIMIESSWVNSNGSLIVRGEPSGNGTVSYRRFLREGDDTGDKHLLASPVGGQDISQFIAAFDSKIDSVRVWKEFDGIWEEIETGQFAGGQGYNIYQSDASDGEFVFTGSLVNTASFTATSPFGLPYSSRGTDPYAETPLQNADNPITAFWTAGRGYIAGDWVNWGGGGWNLLGNPFTSAMSADQFITENSSDFDPYYQALYVYDGKNGYYRYVASVVPGYSDQGDPGFVQGGSFGSRVQAGQGFMVMANNNAVEFNFTPAMQVHNTVLPLLKSATTEDPWPGLKLNVKWGEKENMTTIVFNSEMKNSLDPGFDVGMLSAGPEVEIYTALVENDESINLTRQALPVEGADTVKIPVGIDCYAGAEVTFSAITVPLGDRRFWLEDRTTGIFTDLSLKSYTVTLPANTYGTGRFFIIASTSTPTAIKNPEDVGDNLRIWVSGERLIIRGETGQKALCELYDIQGRRILVRRLSDGELNTIDIPSGLHGVFMVRVTDGAVITTRKIAIL